MDRSTRLYPAAIAAASALVLAAAFAFQHVGGLDPCVLCVYQRYPYGAAIALGLLGLVLPGSGLRAALLALAGMVLLAGAGIAVFHVGVEQHWWEGTAACAGAAAPPGSLDAMMKELDRAPARCDRVAWSFLGLSMAGWNVLISCALAAFSLAAARRLWSLRR